MGGSRGGGSSRVGVLRSHRITARGFLRAEGFPPASRLSVAPSNPRFCGLHWVGGGGGGAGGPPATFWHGQRLDKKNASPWFSHGWRGD